MEDIEYATCVPLTIDFSSEIARERKVEDVLYPWVLLEEGEA